MNKALKRKIDSVDIVSFDIFDTLILRKVSEASDVFELVERKYNLENDDKISQFTKKRIKAEYNARINTNDEEITLEDIYTELHKIDLSLNCAKLKTLENDMEKSICFKNSDFDDIILYCREQNKKIIICSDMYLDKIVIEDILKNANIEYDKLFLSSDLKVKKSTGRIFDYIIQKMNVSKGKMLHIGDNIKSDVLMPKKYYIKTHRYGNEVKYDIKKLHYLNKSIECNLNNNSQIKEDYYFNFGYKYLGPLIFGFCKFIDDNVLSNTNAIFLAREGKIIMDCFKIYNENKKNNKINRINYMYVSRKSISSSLLKKFNNFDEMFKSQSLSQNETVNMFLNRFNLLNPTIENLLLENNISLTSSVYEKNVYNFLNNHFSLLVEGKEDKYNLLKSYLESFEIDENSIIVDIGWNGTMQDLLQEVLNENNLKINGYYLGVRANKKNRYKHGFLFDGNNEEVEILTRSMTGFLEILFAADHGSTYSYEYINNPKPVLLENDISEDIIYLIKNIQNGAKKFIEDFTNDETLKLMNLEKEDYFYNLLDFGLYPKMTDINMFEQFEVFDEKNFDLIGNRYGIKYILKPKTFVKDYIDSSWKNAFMKSIFKLNLPYVSFFKIAYSRRR